jgi:hypothetical protein
MARTPDRRPGESDEEGIILENRPSGDNPAVSGGIRYVDGSFIFKDAVGLFDPRDSIPGGANTEVQFNDNGSLSGSNLLTFNKTTGALTASFFVGNGGFLTNVTASQVYISGAASIDGYLQLLPVGALAIPTNKSASYLYASGSTNDLYYTQYLPGTNFTNTVRMRWLEGALATGLLHGGVLSTANGTTTFSVTSGSALIVDYNASTTTDPYPTARLVTWPAYVSQSLTYVSTDPITYVGINSSGGLIQQNTPFSENDFYDRVSLGRILHQSGNVTNGASTSPIVAYGLNQSNEQFNRAFGPLKVSGHVLSNSGSNLSIAKAAGVSYVAGRNYTSNPNSPNLVLPSTDTIPAVCKIYRQYVSGSTVNIDTGISNAGYSVIDPSLYNNNGTLASVSGGQYTIQRVYWFPNSVNKAFFVYYGSATYTSLDKAESSVGSEAFTEGANTIDAAVYLGAVCVRGNATDLSDAAQARFVQGGLFRGVSVSGGGGGGASTTTPGGLDTYVQFNDGGSTFGGDSGLTYNKTTDTLSVVNLSLAATDDLTFSLKDNSAGALNISAGVGNNRWTFNTGDGQERLGFWDGVRASFGDINDPDLNIQHDGTNSRIENKTGTPTSVFRAGVASPTAPVLEVQDYLGSSVLNVSSSLIESTVPFRGLNGTASSVTYGFTASAGTGMYRGTSGQLLRFAVSNGMAFGVSTTGNVGIGVTATTSPTGRLQVVGDSAAGSTTTLLVQHGASAGSSLPVLDAQDSSGTSLLFVSASGGVGIGTNNPLGSKLYVSSSLTGNAASALIIGGQVFGVSLNTYKAQTHLFQLANTTEAMRIDANANVGIGTGTHSSRLFVSGSSTTSNSTAVLKAGIQLPSGPVVDVQSNSGTTLFYVSGSGELGLGSNISSIQTSTVTTATISTTTLMEVSSSIFRSAEFIVQGTDASGAKYSQTKILAIHNGTASSHTVYGSISLGTSTGTFDVTNPSGGSFLLRVTPSSTNSTVWKVTGILTRV